LYFIGFDVGGTFTDFTMRVEEYELIPDSSGGGEWRCGIMA
jgi:N-methylhydantoinase A/oxoprolinase/acetone carboxylase beta subunit